MLVSELAEKLRRIVRERMAAGTLTGAELARMAGFRQAHISNFLNRRRGLSVEALDRILQALQLSVADLAPNPALARAAASPVGREYDDVPLVTVDVLHHPTIPERAIADVLKFKRSFLRRVRSSGDPRRTDWRRFVLIKASADTATAMYPRISSGATLLIDRHYTSATPYRRREPSIYVIRKDGQAIVRNIEVRQALILLRPANQEVPLEFLPIETGRTHADYIIGRVCHVGMEV
ncbi:MAG TPA: helix-turn-helix domain-containing protein [Clostridia bacterium]|nr:helix-turn-helix domain-containing protein [Clostridia bacterium]